MARQMLNVRVDEWLALLVEEAVELSSCKSMSDWVREAVEAGARREIAAANARKNGQPVPGGNPDLHVIGLESKRSIGGGFAGPRDGVCSHPPTARVDSAMHEACGLCGKVTRSRR